MHNLMPADLVIARLKSFFASPDQVVLSLAIDGDDVRTTRELVQTAGRLC